MKTLTKATVKAYSIGTIATSIKKLDTQRRDITISALYYALTSSNIAYLKSMSQTDVACFDSALRALIPATWQRKGMFWQFSHDKKAASLEKLGLVLDPAKTMSFEEFAPAALAYWESKQEATKKAELTAQEEHDNAAKAFNRYLESVYSKGLTVSEMETAFIMFKKAHTLVQAA